MRADRTSNDLLSSADVDALVAEYAPVGRQLRRRQRLTRIALAMLVPLLIVVLVIAWQVRDDIAASLKPSGDAQRIEDALAEFRDLKASLTAESGAMAAQREALAHQQALFLKHSDQLAAQLVAINAQREALDGQSRELGRQQGVLTAAIEKADTQLQALQARSGKQPEFDRQLAEIGRQKQELQEQQRQFLDRGQALAQELGAINQQRAEIEKQRQAIAEQQAEVRKMLAEINKVSANRLRQKQEALAAAAAAGRQSPPVADPAEPSGPLAQMAAVDPQTLGDVRGGFDLGGDYTIAIGITRTTSIDGIEQFTSAMYIDDLAAAVGAGVAHQGLDPVIIQSGSGNFVGMDTLSNLSPAVATIIQNTLDNQSIANQTVLDITLQNVGTVSQGLHLSNIVNESLTRQP